ncbi:hypothetical protein AAKU58_003828, partial [Oxalobacteraceae bacterium GrIS 1.18]
TLIHSCSFKKQPPALGQISIGRVGQYSTGANIRNSKTPCPTGSTSPINPCSNRLIRATMMPRKALSESLVSQFVNSGMDLIENIVIVIVRLRNTRGFSTC